MNFSQIQERLRIEVLRRIERKVLTASMLARRSGLTQPTISNFLSNRRGFSLRALDRVVAALELDLADLVFAPALPSPPLTSGVPVVSAEVAMHDDVIRLSSVIARMPFPLAPGSPLAPALALRRHPARERFVAVSLTEQQARPMQPRLKPGALVILDRHAVTSTGSGSEEPPIYAIRRDRELRFCYFTFDRNQLLLDFHSHAFRAEAVPVPPGSSPQDLVVGLVAYVLQAP